MNVSTHHGFLESLKGISSRHARLVPNLIVWRLSCLDYRHAHAR